MHCVSFNNFWNSYFGEILKNFYTKFIGFSSKRYFLIIFVLLLLIAGELLYLKNNLKIDTDLKALFKGTNKTVIQLEKMEEQVGSYSTVLVVAHSPDRDKNIEALSRIKEKIIDDPAVRFIEFERDVSYLEKHALLFASVDELKKMRDEIRKEIANQVKGSLSLVEEQNEKNDTSLNSKFDEITEKAESYRKKYKFNQFYEAENGTFVAMKVRPGGSETNVSDTKTIVDLLDRAILETKPEELGVEVEAGGHFRNKLKEMNAIYNDVFSTLAICIFLLFLTIIFYFRSFRALFIVFIPLSAGVLTAITAMQFFIGGFNIISAFSFTILYGLGIDFSIHLLVRFSEERGKSANCREAVISSYVNIVPAIFSGALTTVAAFFSLIFINFKGFSDFGLAAAIGVTASFCAIVLFFPAIIFVFDRFYPLNIKPRKTSFLASIFNFTSAKPLVTFIIFVLITLSAVVSIKFANMEYNFDKLSFPDKNNPDTISSKYVQGVRKNKNDLLSTGLPSFIITENSEQTEDASRALDEIMKSDQKKILLKDHISIYSFIPANQKEKLPIIKDIRRIIERKINLFDEKTTERYNSEFKQFIEVDSEIQKELLPDWIKDKLSLKDGSYDKFMILALGGNKSNVEDVITIRKEYDEIKGDIQNYHVLGSYMLIAEIKNIIDRHVPVAIVFAFLAVLIVLLFLYRSFSEAVTVFIPLSAGILWMILVAVVSGIKFNIFNMVVIPTVIGTGIDSAIHIFHRYKNGKSEKMIENLKNTGGAVFFSSLTTLVGFGSVAFARHKGLQSIGIMASIGIIMVTLVNLVFFPALIVFIKGRSKK